MSTSRSSHSAEAETTPQLDPALAIECDRLLADAVRALVDDRASTAAEIVLATSARTHAWLAAHPSSSWDQTGREIETGLAEWNAAHGWRGPCATWLDALRRAWHAGRDVSRRGAALRPSDVLCEELEHWSRGSTALDSGGQRATQPWNGEPMSEGVRIPSRTELARHAAERLEHGEVVLVSGYSASIFQALERAQREGKRPHAIVSESAPRRDGRRMAEQLARAGLPVTLCCDAAFASNVPRADRVWFATEAIGSESWLGRVGTRHWVEEAERMEVPVALLATSDKLMPGGELRAPSTRDANVRDPDQRDSSTRDSSMRDASMYDSNMHDSETRERDTSLWSDAPPGVRVENKCFEEVSLDAVPAIVTEFGIETATALHLRALRVDLAPPCSVETHGSPSRA
jgi:translation initiation factor 2B subunit (eIF-2B alpha/beta/delta family)